MINMFFHFHYYYGFSLYATKIHYMKSNYSYYTISIVLYFLILQFFGYHFHFMIVIVNIIYYILYILYDIWYIIYYYKYTKYHVILFQIQF